MKLFCFIFVVLCYLAVWEDIIIPPFMYKSIQFPKVSQCKFKTKGLISIEGTFFGTPCTGKHSCLHTAYSNFKISAVSFVKLGRFPLQSLKALFHSSQKPTRKLAARTHIQSHYLKALAFKRCELAFAMSEKEALIW